MAEQNTILELSTTNPSRRKISIDGQLYEIADGDEFSIRDRLRIERIRNAVKEIETKPEDEQEKALQAIDDMFAGLVYAPKEVIAKLRESQKMEIFKTVFSLGGGKIKTSQANADQSRPSNDSSAGM